MPPLALYFKGRGDVSSENSIQIYGFIVAEKKSDKGVNLVASLCQKYHTSEDEVREMIQKANELMSNILKKKSCSASQCKTENLDNIDPGACVIIYAFLTV